MLFAEKVRYSETTHYDYAGFTVPMKLSLYNYYSSSNIISIYNWAPNEPQWWITGFDAYEYLPDPNKMAYIASIDFSEKDGFIDVFRDKNTLKYFGKHLSDYSIIIDEITKTLWIQWYA